MSRPVPGIDLDLHGRTLQQAALSLLNALSRCEGRNGFALRVIHGKGTFALAHQVDQLAAADPRIERVERDPGNQGVTVLHLNALRLGTRDHAARIALGIMEPPERRRAR